MSQGLIELSARKVRICLYFSNSSSISLKGPGFLMGGSVNKRRATQQGNQAGHMLVRKEAKKRPFQSVLALRM